MSTIILEECLCGLEPRNEVFLCAHHHYFGKGKRYTSVSRVINAVLPTDFSRIDPNVLECARLRGKFVDDYFCDWIRDSRNVVASEVVREMVAPHFPQDQEKHADDVVRRIELLLNWWERQGYKRATVQHIFSNDELAIAGAADLVVADMIFDIKCVSKLQPSYKLQLGAYRSMDLEGRNISILHVTPKKVIPVRYDWLECRLQWAAAVGWYQRLIELKPQAVSEEDIL